MRSRNHVSPLVIIEAGLCFGGISILWLIGTWVLGEELLDSGTARADIVEVIVLGGVGLIGVALLAHGASNGVQGAGAWFLLLFCLACGFAALGRGDPPVLHGRYDPNDIWFSYLPTLATIHLLLVASRRSLANRPAKVSA